MKETVKSTLALTGTLVVAGMVLAGFHSWISPVVETSAEQQRVEEYFPDAEFEKVPELHNPITLVVTDSAGEEKGFVVEDSTEGYNGNIRYYVGIDKQGQIKGLNILEHTETMGIGDAIESKNFQEQFIGKNHEDTIGEEVDTISGATISTQSMINSVEGTLKKTAQNFLGVEEVEIELADIPDGTYTGRGSGQRGGLEVEVTVKNGFIENIEIIEHDETPDYFAKAEDELPQRIKSAQDLEVDTVTGATGTSEGIIDAVRDALTVAVEEIETAQN